jgi:DNA-binding SARP family transcriptional activator
VALHLVEFRVLGPFEVDLAGEPVEVGSRKQRMLLSALVVEANRLVAADTLGRLLWDDAPPPSADVTLRSLVSRLRRALGDAGSCLEGRDGGYRLRVDPTGIDAVRFERHLARGRHQLAAGHAGEAVETLNAALALWRGPALLEIADHDVGRVVAHRLEEERAARSSSRRISPSAGRRTR